MYPECASQCCKFYLNGRMFYIFISILYVIVRALYCIMKCLDVQRKMQCTYWFTCTLSIFIYSYNPIDFNHLFSLSPLVRKETIWDTFIFSDNYQNKNKTKKSVNFQQDLGDFIYSKWMYKVFTWKFVLAPIEWNYIAL